MNRRSALAVVLFLAGACGGAPAAHSPPPREASPRPAFLPITGLRILRETHQARTAELCPEAPPTSIEPSIVLHENGLLALDGEPLGKLTADGRFVDLDGTERLAMSPDGRVELQNLVLIVAPDGTVTTRFEGIPESVTRLQPDGTLGIRSFVTSRGPTGESVVRCTGYLIESFTPELGRTAMFAMIVIDLIRARAW